jgi:hypothetical protein
MKTNQQLLEKENAEFRKEKASIDPHTLISVLFQTLAIFKDNNTNPEKIEPAMKAMARAAFPETDFSTLSTLSPTLSSAPGVVLSQTTAATTKVPSTTTPTPTATGPTAKPPQKTSSKKKTSSK